jgi:trehalose 6-phosphate synthase/phosphatase
MSRLIIVSNRLPISFSLSQGELSFHHSVGGLTTGLSNIKTERDTIWFGWPGIESDGLTSDQLSYIQTQANNLNYHPVQLTHEEVELFYHGYANTTLWPLCHYFIEKTTQKQIEWDMYQRVNQKFFESIEHVLTPDSVVWIHDYQLMLLPAMLRKKYPKLKIGYFHHIPFPSFELFRLLSTKVELLKGLLGADLIGFHTYDYVRHFLSSVGRILHLDRQLFKIQYGHRLIQVDAFPMGIDTDFFKGHTIKKRNLKEKLILSVDRLDYTKGILERLNGYELFLDTYPQYREKVKMQLIIAPSREVLESYEQLKATIDQQVSRINSKFGSAAWMPIWYLYQTFSQEQLLEWYAQADIMLVTPLRDGMNLVSKEYLAARKDLQGALILSETAGASGELSEAFIINPTQPIAIATAIKEALETPKEVLMTVNAQMVERIERTNVHYWIKTFLQRLEQIQEITPSIPPPLDDVSFSTVLQQYQQANARLIVLDYDGTLIPIRPTPDLAKPTLSIKQFITRLANVDQQEVAIVSGRDFRTLSSWFKDLPIHLSGNHGNVIRFKKGNVRRLTSIETSWKKPFKDMLYRFQNQMPGSLLEEKMYSLAFHYRQCEPDMVKVRFGEIIDALESIKGKSNLQILLGHKVIEVKDARVDKGQALQAIVNENKFDFILIAGDDRTDEAMFEHFPQAITIHVGNQISQAKYSVNDSFALREWLDRFVPKS